MRDYENFLACSEDFLRWCAVAEDNMREGMRKGIVLPRVLVERMIPQMESFVVERAEDSVFWRPVAAMPGDFGGADRTRLAAAYRESILRRLVPAYRELGRFLAEEYLPAARESVGYSALPGGDGWYDALVAWHTTTDLSARDLHRIGLEEVARIRGEMEGVRARVGFEDDLAAFFACLKTDPAFFWASAEAVLADYRAVEDRVKRGLPALFNVAPKAGFEIRPTPEFRADSAASAEYESPPADGSRPGVFYLNTWDLSRLPRWGMVTLFLHEAIPGHHFQSAIARELEGVPDLQRFSGYTAYTEGWALYSEDLGRELGLFEDPYPYFGKLNDEMLRAMRLVVDTGLHRYGWSREQAIEYMQDNSSLPEAEIVAEVERYIATPGQALAYKAGQLELRALRAEAAAALGDDFDLAAWHDMVLTGGEMPLALLRARSHRWISGSDSG